MKLIGTVWPRAGMSVQGFRSYYREIHGPIVAKEPGETRRYVQNYVDDAVVYCEGPRPPVTPPIGITELWYDDESGVVATFTAPYAIEVSAADVHNYADLSRGIGLLGDERAIHGDTTGSGATKTMIMCLLQGSRDTLPTDFCDTISKAIRSQNLSELGVEGALLAIEGNRESDMVRAFASAPGRPQCVAAVSLFLKPGTGWNRPSIADAVVESAERALGTSCFAMEMLLDPHVVMDRMGS